MKVVGWLQGCGSFLFYVIHICWQSKCFCWRWWSEHNVLLSMELHSSLRDCKNWISIYCTSIWVSYFLSNHLSSFKLFCVFAFSNIVAILLWSCKRNTCKFWNNFFAREFFWSASSLINPKLSKFNPSQPRFSSFQLWVWFLQPFEMSIFFYIFRSWCLLCVLFAQEFYVDPMNTWTRLKWKVLCNFSVNDSSQSWICKSFMYLATWAKVVTRDLSTWEGHGVASYTSIVVLIWTRKEHWSSNFVEVAKVQNIFGFDNRYHQTNIWHKLVCKSKEDGFVTII